MKIGFIGCDELIEIHGKCGNLLHAQSSFKENVDYKHYEKEIPNWMNQIMKLLNCHQIRLLGRDSFYLVHMKGERDNQVQYVRVRSHRIAIPIVDAPANISSLCPARNALSRL